MSWCVSDSTFERFGGYRGWWVRCVCMCLGGGGGGCQAAGRLIQVVPYLAGPWVAGEPSHLPPPILTCIPTPCPPQALLPTGKSFTNYLLYSIHSDLLLTITVLAFKLNDYSLLCIFFIVSL